MDLHFDQVIPGRPLPGQRIGKSWMWFSGCGISIRDAGAAQKSLEAIQGWRTAYTRVSLAVSLKLSSLQPMLANHRRRTFPVENPHYDELLLIARTSTPMRRLLPHYETSLVVHSSNSNLTVSRPADMSPLSTARPSHTPFSLQTPSQPRSRNNPAIPSAPAESALQPSSPQHQQSVP